MEIIFHNVNVILPNGEIFASGDKSRIGKIHEAGRKAALDKKRVNIYPQNANLFKGVAPGINQPIIIDGEVQLVIGVTGNPNEIVRYAELAFLTAELLITQAISNENSNRKSSLKDLEFATLVFDPKTNPIDENKEKELENYIKLPRYAYLVVIEKDRNYQDIVYEAITQIRKLPNQSEIIVITTNTLIILNENKLSFSQEKIILQEISKTNKIKILVGKYDKISANINQYGSLLPLIGSGIKVLENEIKWFFAKSVESRE